MNSHTTDRGSGRILGLAAAGSFMVALDATAVTTSLARIRLDLGASVSQLEWIVNAYALSFAVLLMTGAALGDRFGRRRMFAAGIGLFTVASAACALAPDAGWLVAVRAVQGCGAALVMPLAMALLSAAFPPERRAAALGLFAGLTGLAVTAGPPLGGAITQGLAWEWIFWLNVPVGLFLVPAVLRWVPESRGPGGALDLPGVALATCGAFGLVWGLVRAPEAGWGGIEVPLALVLGAAGLLLFVRWERRAPSPMVPMGLFGSRPFAEGNVSGFFLYAALYGALFYVAQFLQTAQGHGPLSAGLRMLPWTATVTVAAPLAGRLVNRIGARRLTVTGLSLQAAGLLWLAAVAAPGTGLLWLVPPMIVAGCGVSMAMPAAQASVINAVPPPQIGRASGVFNTLRQLGGAFGVAVTVPVFTATGGYSSPASFARGAGPAFAVCALLSLAGAVPGVLAALVSRAGAPRARVRSAAS
ncbi:MFS transporter [Actinocorallia longicatena]|uniref:DHA2 family efflux MFS transporter permease subunit n=1 Tax=Actinocorallia longicatena TaxID=111803 RepID=A0ABP6PVJ0_9ACTN